MPGPSFEAKQAIALALAEARHHRSPALGMPHLLVALGKPDRVTAADLCINLNCCLGLACGQKVGEQWM